MTTCNPLEEDPLAGGDDDMEGGGASTQEKKSGDWDDQSPDRELFKGLSRDRVLRRRVTGPRGS